MKSKLVHLSAHFEKCITSYLDFWDIMDEIDANTCVLEPEMPSRDATRRRIALGTTVFHHNLKTLFMFIHV